MPKPLHADMTRTTSGGNRPCWSSVPLLLLMLLLIPSNLSSAAESSSAVAPLRKKTGA
jgi:hypothetical protein